MGHRRQSGLLEEILLGFAHLPLWAAVVGATIFYVVLRFVCPLLAGTSPTGKAFAIFFPQIAPWAAFAILMAGAVGVARRWWRRRLLGFGTTTNNVRHLDWPDFELLVGELYRRQGYTVIEHGGAHADGGIDIELRRGNELVIVQCKHWMSRQVPVQHVRELLGVVTATGAIRGVLVATAGFTQDARNFAAGKSIELIDGDQLAKLTKAIREKPVSPMSSDGVSLRPPATPTCPVCGKPMIRRTARRGARAGSDFWGCSSYPSCRGTRAA